MMLRFLHSFTFPGDFVIQISGIQACLDCPFDCPFNSWTVESIMRCQCFMTLFLLIDNLLFSVSRIADREIDKNRRWTNRLKFSRLMNRDDGLDDCLGKYKNKGWIIDLPDVISQNSLIAHYPINRSYDEISRKSPRQKGASCEQRLRMDSSRCLQIRSHGILEKGIKSKWRPFSWQQQRHEVVTIELSTLLFSNLRIPTLNFPINSRSSSPFITGNAFRDFCSPRLCDEDSPGESRILTLL